jgi:putative transcriptional regulator
MNNFGKKIQRSFLRCFPAIFALVLLTLTIVPVPAASVYGQAQLYGAKRPNSPALPTPSIFAIPAKGKFLIASANLQPDPRFRETVVLLIEYGPAGTMGLIINRPTPVRLGDLIKDLPELKTHPDRAFYGGPVEINRMFLLIRSLKLVEESSRVIEGVHMTTSRAILEQMISGKLRLSFRSYAGYAGWAAGQLDAEIARGDWYVTNSDVRMIFEQDPGTLWPELIRRVSTIQA